MTTATEASDHDAARVARGQIARRRGALIGFILLALGAWGALIAFIGPYFGYAYTPRAGTAWHWTASRGWLEVLPGVLAAGGGLLVMTSARRAVAVFGAWLAAAAGAWFAIGSSFEPVLHTGTPGVAAGAHAWVRTLEQLGFFYGLGVVIVFFAATASGRLSVRSLADIHRAQHTIAEEAGATRRAVELEVATQRATEQRATEQRGAQGGSVPTTPHVTTPNPAHGSLDLPG